MGATQGAAKAEMPEENGDQQSKAGEIKGEVEINDDGAENRRIGKMRECGSNTSSTAKQAPKKLDACRGPGRSITHEPLVPSFGGLGSAA